MEGLKVFFIFIAFIVSVDSLCEDEFFFKNNWEKNDRFKYEIKQKILRDFGGYKKEYNVTYVAELFVSGVTNELKNIEWKYTNIKISTDKKIEKEIYGCMNGLVLKYNINREGNFIGIVNWDEIQGNFFKNIDQLKKNYKKKEIIDILESSKSIFESKVKTERENINEILILHNCYGEKLLYLKENIRTKTFDKLGEEFKFSIKVTINLKTNNSNKEINLDYSEELDKDKALVEMKNLYKKQMGEEKFAELEKTDMPIIVPIEFSRKIDYSLKQIDNSITKIKSNENVSSTGTMKFIDIIELMLVEKK